MIEKKVFMKLQILVRYDIRELWFPFIKFTIDHLFPPPLGFQVFCFHSSAEHQALWRLSAFSNQCEGNFKFLTFLDFTFHISEFSDFTSFQIYRKENMHLRQISLVGISNLWPKCSNRFQISDVWGLCICFQISDFLGFHISFQI